MSEARPRGANGARAARARRARPLCKAFPALQNFSRSARRLLEAPGGSWKLLGTPGSFWTWWQFATTSLPECSLLEVPGGSWDFQGLSSTYIARTGRFWRFLGTPGGATGGSWRLLELQKASGGFWRLLEGLLEAPGGSWRLLEAPGDSWRLLEAPRLEGLQTYSPSTCRAPTQLLFPDISPTGHFESNLFTIHFKRNLAFYI